MVRQNGPDVRAETAASEFRVRARFYAIRQVDGESTHDWYARVRLAAHSCGFGVHRLESAIADKFVTGLRPGPVADRLFGERADGRLDDLLAVVVATEKAEESRKGSAETLATDRDHVLTEIREGLKLYRYSSDEYAGVVGGNDSINDYKSLTESSEKKFTDLEGKSWWKQKMKKKSIKFENKINNYSPFTCKICCNLATKLLDNFEEKHPFHELNKNENFEVRTGKKHDVDHNNNSKCYCSLFTNSECKKGFKMY